MTLAQNWVLHFLWILPVVGFLLIIQNRMRQQARQRFAEKALLARLTPDDHKGKRLIKGALILCVIGLMIVALAGPRYGSRWQEVSRKGVDIMMVLDVSASMAVEDVKPNRLERAGREIIDFLKVVQGDRIGLTVFAGAAFIQCPLTLDYAAVEMFVSALSPGAISVPGTDMGAAIETGLLAFNFKAETDKVIMLITDGEDNENKGLKAAQKAAAKGVKVFVFGIGEPTGGPVPESGDKGGFKKDKDGKLILSKLNETTLRQIASATGGDYVRSMAGDLDLDLLYFEGIQKKTEAQTLKSGKLQVHEERFAIFVFIAFLLLFVEGFVDDKRRKGKKRFKFLPGFLICMLAGLCLQHPINAAELSSDEQYRQGRYAEAMAAYAKQDMDHPKDVRYRYNRGCAAFQTEAYTDASAAFESVLRRTKDPRTRFNAAYNLGNTAFKSEDFTAAVSYYANALKIDPADPDARYNLELALREQKKAQASPPQSQGNDQDSQKSCKNPGEGGTSENQPTDESQPGQPGKPGKSDKLDKPDKSDKSGQSEQPKQPDQPDQTKQPPSEAKAESEAEREMENGNAAPSKQSKPDTQQTAENEQVPQASVREKSDTDDAPMPTGELKARNALPQLQTPEADKAGSDLTSDAKTAEKMAEALLENIKEDPSRILQFMVPGKNQDGAVSQKDW